MKNKRKIPLIIIENIISIVITIFFIKEFFIKEISKSIMFALIVTVTYFSILGVLNRIFEKNYQGKRKIKNKKTKVVLLGCLFLIISVPSIFADSRTEDKIENRNLAEYPVRIDSKDFQKCFENWINDHFLLRNEYITINKVVKSVFNPNKAKNDSAFEGKNGWLFFTGNNQILDYQRLKIFTNEELEKIRKNLEKEKLWLEKQNIKFYLFVPPTKNSVYPEFYPDYFLKLNNKSRINQLVEYLKKNSDINIIYPLDYILEHKKDGELEYYKSDTHWNYYGAYNGYAALMDIIREDFPDVRDLKRDSFEIEKIEQDKENLDLARMLKLKGKEIIPSLKFKENFTYKIVENDERKKIIKTHNDQGKYNVVMLRDSYTTGMMVELSQTFNNIEYYWTRDFNVVNNNIEKNKPDIVIEEVLERYIESLGDEKLY